VLLTFTKYRYVTVSRLCCSLMLVCTLLCCKIRIEFIWQDAFSKKVKSKWHCHFMQKLNMLLVCCSSSKMSMWCGLSLFCWRFYFHFICIEYVSMKTMWLAAKGPLCNPRQIRCRLMNKANWWNHNLTNFSVFFIAVKAVCSVSAENEILGWNWQYDV